MSRTYRKSARAQSSDDFETWVEDSVTNTLNSFDVGDIRATELVVGVFQYKDSGSMSEIAPTLRALPHDKSHMNGGGHLAVLTSSTADHPARPTVMRVNGVVLGTSVTDGLRPSGSCPHCGHDGRSLRMSRDFYPLMKDVVSGASSEHWMNSGSMSRGRYWTQDTSESRNAAAACSLSQVLEAEAPSRYFLSAKAAAGILRRATRRGKTLPAPLEAALRTLSEGIAPI